jgi:hypothetical protein
VGFGRQSTTNALPVHLSQKLIFCIEENDSKKNVC